MQIGGTHDGFRRGASWALFFALTLPSHRAGGAPAGFIVSLNGDWTAEKTGGRRLVVGETVESGIKIYPPTEATRAHIEIALYNAPTLLRQDCGDVVGCPPVVVPHPQPGRSGKASILRAVQQLFLEAPHRYDVTIARDPPHGPGPALQSAVLGFRDDRWSARPSLMVDTGKSGERTYGVRSVGDDGSLGPALPKPTLTVRRTGDTEEITVDGDLPPGLYDIWDLDRADSRASAMPATLGTWILVAEPDQTLALQRRFADASASIQWTGRASDTRASVLRAYLVHLKTHPND